MRTLFESGVMTGTIVVIMNPSARSVPSDGMTAEVIGERLTSTGLGATVLMTESAEETSHAAEQASRGGARCVVAVGGDGTIGAVASGLLSSGVDTPLGIVPLGTMNNIATALGIPPEWKAALDLIASRVRSEEFRAMDCGLAGDKPFFEVASVGVIANLVPAGESFIRRPWRLPRALGEMVVVLREARATRMTITLDRRQVRVRASQVTILNAPAFGLRFAPAPSARLDDGLLDVVIYERLRAWDVLWLTLASIGGRQIAHPHMYHFQARAVSVRPRRTLRIQVDGGLDGECGSTPGMPPLRVRCLPAALRVCAGSERTATGQEIAGGVVRALLREVPASTVTTPVRAAVSAVQSTVAAVGQPVKATISAATEPARKSVEPPRRAARRISGIRAVYAGALLIVTISAIGARKLGLLPGDLEMTQAIQRHRSPALDGAMTAIAIPGFPPQSGGIVALVACMFWTLGLRLEAVSTALTAGVDALNFVLKRVVRRSRPTADQVHVARVIREPGFPSGHVMHYVAFYGFIAAAAIANLRPSPVRRGIVGACAALTALVGPARVYLGAHWPSDVAAGYLTGGMYLGGLLELYARLKARQSNRTV